ncbi:MAG TPA: ABC transporter substrate-binding protein [candidate division Zixibacteria bacterium]|nr:ABC transporter substrate-binding protein [candidate division Zixibacteria bacterium]
MFNSAALKSAYGSAGRFRRSRNWMLSGVAAFLLLPVFGHAQAPPGRVVYLKENRIYVDWDKSSGIKKGKTVFVTLGQETLGTATVGWVLEDLTMVEMATGFSRLTGISREALSIQPEKERMVVRGGSFAVGMANPLETDWAKKIPAPDNFSLLSCLYEGLVAETEEGRFRAVLADSFKTGERWVVFYLKPGLSFHSGRRLTAYEIKKVLDVNLSTRSPEYVRFAGLLAPRAAWPKRFPPLTSPIEARDTGTLVVHLKGNPGLALSYLASPLGWVKDLLDTLPRFPAGSGPFRVDVIRATGLRLLRNKNYHGPAPQADTLTFRWFGQREDAEAAFLRGEVSLAWFKAGELSQVLRYDPGVKEKELCHFSAKKQVAAFYLRPVSPDSSRMLASGAAHATENLGPDLYRGDWLSEKPVSARPDSFKVTFLVDRELDSTGLLPAYLSTTRSDLPLFEMHLAQIETFVPAREVRLAALLGKLKEYTGSRVADSLSMTLNKALFSPAKDKETLLNGIEKFLVDRFGLVFLYRPAMAVLARPELSGFGCSSFPHYFRMSKTSQAVGLR